MLLHPSFDVNAAGHLTVAGFDACELAEQFGTPAYFLDEDAVRAQCRLYREAFRESFGGSSLPAYAFGRSGEAFCFHLYVAGETEALVNGQPLRLKIDSALPWKGDVEVTVLSGSAEGPLVFRIPGWTKDPLISVPEGRKVQALDGYWHVSGLWKAGDVIRLTLPMPVRALTANPRVREDAGQIAVSRGPVVYCAEEKDNGPLLHLLTVSPGEIAGARTVETEIGGLGLTALELPASRRKAPERAPLYRDWTPPEADPVTLRLIPYFAWANRGEGEMRVWIRAESQA